MTAEEKTRIYLNCDECKFANVEGYCDVCVANKTAQPVLDRINLILEKERHEWVEKAAKWFREHAEDFIDDEGGTIMPYIEDECFVEFKKAMEEELCQTRQK